MSQHDINLHFYPTFVSRLVKDMGSHRDNIMHGAIGISSEAGELLDATKKNWAYGKPLDFENIMEELGDIEFYMEAFRQAVGVTREETIAHNLKKLSARYASGNYSDAQAIARADKELGVQE
jgi:NTP pyrophosphatase (non-canonical NTP hydrolase)